jgi:hypothetical protein
MSAIKAHRHWRNYGHIGGIGASHFGARNDAENPAETPGKASRRKRLDRASRQGCHADRAWFRNERVPKNTLSLNKRFFSWAAERPE